MASQNVRFVFALLCLLGLLAVAAGALWEVRNAQRGTTSLTPRHLRWRLFSAGLWILILAVLAFATLFQWPEAPAKGAAAHSRERHFVAEIAGSMLLIPVALVILSFDVAATVREQRSLRTQVRQNLEEMARLEIDRVRSSSMPMQNGSSGSQ